MAETATQLTDKFRRDVEKVSKDKVQGEIVQRLRNLFAHAPEIRAKGMVHVTVVKSGSEAGNRPARIVRPKSAVSVKKKKK